MFELKADIYDYWTGAYGTLELRATGGACEIAVNWADPATGLRPADAEVRIGNDIAAELYRLLGYYLNHELPQ